MKPAFESLSSYQENSFIVRKFEEEAFASPYHFHPEYELTYIISGVGRRYVGTSMSDFFAGDFVLLGANLPHCWKTDTVNSKEKSRSVVVQFQECFLGNEFFEKPELMCISQLLRKSENGIQFTGKTENYRGKMLQILDEKNCFKKLLFILDLLHELSRTKTYAVLEKQKTATELSAAQQQRIHTAMAYIIDNFKTQVSLAKAASLANMTPHSFCKYFKKVTRKTFMEAVTDFRIDYASQQLIQTGDSISQISFNSGFNDVSNFHKTFKSRRKLSPLNYRTAFLKKLE